MLGKNAFGYFSALTVAAVLAIGSPGTSVAASACQGLSESACKGNSECTWMSGYTRKDGVAVSAHCRSKGKASGAAQEPEKKGGPAEASEAKNKSTKDSSKSKDKASGAAQEPEKKGVPAEASEAKKKSTQDSSKK